LIPSKPERLKGEDAFARELAAFSRRMICRRPGPKLAQYRIKRRKRRVFALSYLVTNQGGPMATQMSKSQLIEQIANATELAKKDVKGVMESLATIGYKELKKNGVFVLPGFAKFVVIKKPATKARTGINPFTGQPATFKAKPARKVVRARPVKAAKDAV
jgi:nucleoid DNA-binding protein